MTRFADEQPQYKKGRHLTAATIRIEEQDPAKKWFRAVAGSSESTGRTPGEALDSLLAKEGKSVESSAILIQRLVPDAFFTQAQFDRMQDLMARRGELTAEENAELDALVDAELDATVSRTDALLL